MRKLPALQALQARQGLPSLLALLLTLPASAASVRFDLTRPETVRAWSSDNDIAALRSTPEGMAIAISGSDPYLHGPARDYPAGQPLWLRARLRAERSGTAQVFWFTASRPADEAHSVRFPVRAGAWRDVRVPMPPLGPGTILRFDPPGDGGTAVLASLTLEPRAVLKAPAWPRPAAPRLGNNALTIRSGDLVLRHAPHQLGGFEARVAGRPMGIGNTRPLIGYLRGDAIRWLDIAPRAKVAASQDRDGITVRATATDADGAAWTVRQRFTPAKPGAIDVETRVTCSKDRDVVFLPLFVVLPGAGTPGVGAFGQRKHQALFAGLEYLEADEPSSSEKDIAGPGARRQVPDTEKITFPLMAVQAGGRYIGLTWSPTPKVCALFDSPDRTFRAGGHAMGLLFPGANGTDREEGSLLPYGPVPLPANEPVIGRATLIGGPGESIVPAVRQYVALRGLPPVPDTGLDWPGYARLAAAGWLDSGIREGDRYRHAYPGSFGPQPAGDAAFWMDWLAPRAPSSGDLDAVLAERLRDASAGALAQIEPSQVNTAAIGHVTTPAPALAFGRAVESLSASLQAGRDLLGRFEPDGAVLYRPAPGATDYGRTHFARHANGLAAPLVSRLLEAASYTADPELMREGLRTLRALDRYANTAPRGAQTWEVPLHTPDILASAHLVAAYTRGYELTGDPAFLASARYWAWTGVPFVYLTKPATGSVGPYATIAVYGATNWTAPNWMGLPVQWCGLVYADALSRLAPYDPSGPWKRIADGIAASGVQQTHPLGLDPKRQGLLPDSFDLRAQVRNDVAINPATLLPSAIRLYGRPFPYTFHAFRQSGAMLHAPAPVTGLSETGRRLAFTVQGRTDRTYQVLLSGLASKPGVRIDGRSLDAADPGPYHPAQRALILELRGTTRIEVELAP